MRLVGLAGVIACFGAFFALGLVAGRREARVCEQRLNNTLDFIGLVVGDVEATAERAAAVLSSAQQMIETSKDVSAQQENRHVKSVSGKKYGVNDFPTACVGEICYVQIDGAWKLLEGETP